MSEEAEAMSVSMGVLSRRKTWRCRSAAPAVSLRKVLLVAMTTALFATLSQGSSRFMTPKSSSSFCGV